MRKKTCVLGLGLMGRRAVVRLVGQGHEVVAWNRTTGPEFDEIAKIATLAKSPCDAVQDAATVVIFLHDAQAVVDVLLTSGAGDCLAPDALIADMGTNTPEAARYVASQLAGTARFVDAPVSGGTKGAEEGTLSIFLGANDQDVPAAQAALRDLGQVRHMGDVGAGQAAKLANQIVVACSIAGLAEGVAYGEALGLEPGALIAAMTGGLADSRVLETIGARITAGDFAPLGRASTHLKDLDCAFSQLDGANRNLPATAAAQRHLLRVLQDFGDLDHGAMVLSARAALSGSSGAAPKPKLREPQT